MQLPKKEHQQFIDKKRREGIYQFNLIKMKETAFSKSSENSLMRERRLKLSDRVNMCLGCNKFLSSLNFRKHKCTVLNAGLANLNFVCSDRVHKDPEFAEEILKRFRATDAGQLCREDPLIKQVGCRHFCLRRSEQGKKDEIRKCVMSEMRELARLFIKFKSLAMVPVTTEDMFTRRHISVLMLTIEEMVSCEGSKKEKHGLKLQLNAISIKSLKGFFNDTLQDAKCEELERFWSAYKFRTPEMFSDARYESIKKFLNKARRPEMLPVKDEMEKLKIFTQAEIARITQAFDQKQYAWLRSLVVSRITLYNGRRGEEGSRLLIKEWQDAIEGTWLPAEQVNIQDEAEQYLIGQYRLAYIHGKGRKFVPILIPIDVIAAGHLLLKHREAHGVTPENIFLFPTKFSNSHCSGWHALRTL